MSSLVEVVITVTKFKAKSSPGRPAKSAPQENCDIERELKLAGSNARATAGWKFDATSQVFLCPLPDAAIPNTGIIAIRKTGSAPVEFTFTIESAPGALTPGMSALRPTAIEFEQQAFKDNSSRNREDSNGSQNFQLIGTAGNTLTIADKWISRGPSRNRNQHAAPFWKFWIRVEATAANGDSLVGWIDPTIENSDDMAV